MLKTKIEVFLRSFLKCLKIKPIFKEIIRSVQTLRSKERKGERNAELEFSKRKGTPFMPRDTQLFFHKMIFSLERKPSRKSSLFEILFLPPYYSPRLKQQASERASNG